MKNYFKFGALGPLAYCTFCSSELMRRLTYSAFVFVSLVGDGRRVAAGGRRAVKRHCDTDARDANENHRNDVDDDEQQQEEAATKVTSQVVEAIGADLA